MSAARIWKFSREAMATVFEIFIEAEDGGYARQGADAAWAELERLEEELSRYRQSSYITRINRAAPGMGVRVSPDVFACLAVAEEVRRRTRGVFFVAGGGPGEGPALHLDPERLVVTRNAPGVHLDLGGIGKGFALDVMGEVLAGWELDRALLQSGGSTVLALGAPRAEPEGWRVNLFPGVGLEREFRLQGEALSGSGCELKGAHIAGPGGEAPEADRQAWALAPNATEADALSTACMLLEPVEISRLCQDFPFLGAALYRPGQPPGEQRRAWGRLAVFSCRE